MVNLLTSTTTTDNESITIVSDNTGYILGSYTQDHDNFDLIEDAIASDTPAPIVALLMNSKAAKVNRWLSSLNNSRIDIDMYGNVTIDSIPAPMYITGQALAMAEHQDPNIDNLLTHYDAIMDNDLDDLPSIISMMNKYFTQNNNTLAIGKFGEFIGVGNLDTNGYKWRYRGILPKTLDSTYDNVDSHGYFQIQENTLALEELYGFNPSNNNLAYPNGSEYDNVPITTIMVRP